MNTKRVAVVLLALMAFPCWAATEVNLPPPTEWEAPLGAPTAPGNALTVTFTGATVAQGPVIAEGNETALPDESFTLAGARFTLRGGERAGSDCVVWLWADTPAGGELHSCRVWHVEDSLLTATVPAGLPYGMYLVWVENEAGASAPVCLNRPRLSWIGPIDARAAPGSAKRVFGFNLAHDHGKTLSHVYWRSADGGALTALPVTAVEPYAVTFTAPTQPGSYKICAHAGHGGRFGWSAPLDLTVATPWTRGTNSVTVQPSGTNDLTAIQNAIDAMAGQAQGGTVRLVTGTYHLRPSNTRGSLQLKAGVCLGGTGKETTVVRLEWPGGSEETALLLLENSQIEALTIRIGSISGNGRIVRCTSGQGRLVNLRVDGDPELTDPSPCLLFEKGEITGCDLYRWIFTAGADGLWIHHNNLYGTLHGMDGAIGTIFPNTRMVVENNYFATPAWPVGPGGRRDYLNFMPPAEYRKLNFCTRLYWGCGSRQYWAHNTAHDIGPGHDDYNKGETILLDIGTTDRYAQVASVQGDTLTIRTDGTIDGHTTRIENNAKPMTSIPSGRGSVVIVRGPGRGQKRGIASSARATLTVDQPWRVPPEAGSVISIVRADEDNIIFENVIDALPEGYVPFWSANCGPDFDGNGWKSVAEGNLTRRTFTACNIGGSISAPGYWNTLRNERAEEVHRTGFKIDYWRGPDTDRVGAASLGNRYLGGHVSFRTKSQLAEGGGGIQVAAHLGGVANAIEGMTSTGSLYGISGSNGDQTLLRNNRLALARASGSKPRVGIKSDPVGPASAAWCGNVISGSDGVYDCAPGPRIAPLNRVAVFGMPLASTWGQSRIPVANLGGVTVSWRIAGVSAPWIQAAIGAGSTLPGQDAGGVLNVAIDSSQLPAGVTWGEVRLASPACESLLSSQSGKGVPLNDLGYGKEIGMRFRTDYAGRITRIRFCREDRDAQEGKSHTGRLWSANGTLLRSVVFTHMSNRGWQEAVLDEPLEVTAGLEYVVSVDGHWWEVAAQNGHTKPIVSGRITGLSTVYGPPGACPSTVNPHLRFRDVVFEPAGVEDTRVVGVKALGPRAPLKKSLDQ